ncbi:sortase domain-containing protein [Nocardioides abyssi]|uniref:Sortase n=1 Tax=Nocardioides abyssi TaxID=3058370 RepID=A0ABT8EV79_9ACTN|nr:sortase [Nocardioides abyssi]MDN4161979.1 sortase [Nocardioides abyssi]
MEVRARPRAAPGGWAAPVAGLVAALVVAVCLTACTSDDGFPTSADGPTSGSAQPSERPERTAPTGLVAPERTPTYVAADGRPRSARLTVPAIGLTGLAVVPYRGWTDDAPGTLIQDRGVASSPHGPRGGTGPGGVGNFQVTAHRLSSTRAFERLPELRRGDVVHVEAGRVRYTYRVTTTRRTSFRSAASLRAQRAAVPGRPGEQPTRPMITLSTCATVEDHAVGNYWADRFGNPEHRIDKIGVLVRSRPVGAGAAGSGVSRR